MKRFDILLAFSVLLFLSSCGKASKFPMDKPYWGVLEYDQAIKEIRFKTPQDEKYPTLDDPETSSVVQKLIDKNNISVVADDSSLGIQFKAEFLSDMFDRYRELAQLYGGKMDREDKFIYDVELVEIMKFGLFLQVHYFKAGNDKILAQADSPESEKRTLKGNEGIIVKNFNNYLDYVNYEKSFSDTALDAYVTGLEEGFNFLMVTFPDAPYAAGITKAEAMEQKASNANLKSALGRLIGKLREKIPVEPAS